MKIYVNGENEIKDVGTTSDSTLIEVEISDDNNPFADWSVARICCFKVEVKEGNIAGYLPYVNSAIIEHLDRLSNVDESITNDVNDTQMGLAETYEKTLSNESNVTDLELAVTELYELMLGGV